MKNKQIIIVGLSLIALSVSGVLLYPHLMKQWSFDRPFGSLHLLLSILAGAVGSAGIFLVFRDICRKHKKDWMREGMFLFADYLLLQIVCGILVGGIGVILTKGMGTDYEQIKNILYVMTSILQNLVRTGVLYILIERIYGRNWKKDISYLIRGLGYGTVFSIAGLLCLAVPVETVKMAVQVVWSVIYILIFIQYFVNYGFVCKRGNERNEGKNQQVV